MTPLIRETLTLRLPTRLHRHLKAMAVDNGSPSTNYPAFMPDAPQVESGGGNPLASPKFVPVFFSGDDPAMVSQLVDFHAKVGSTALPAIGCTAKSKAAAENAARAKGRRMRGTVRQSDEFGERGRKALPRQPCWRIVRRPDEPVAEV